jgi:hypothetical protein
MFNWLVHGCTSTIELEEKPLSLIFTETFLIIKSNEILVFTTHQNRNYFYELFAKINSAVEYYFLTKEDEENTEILQIKKIAKFIEMTNPLKRIGIPLSIKEKSSIVEVEKWPLINATGLDAFGEGFFTMKHKIIDISSQ